MGFFRFISNTLAIVLGFIFLNYGLYFVLDIMFLGPEYILLTIWGVVGLAVMVKYLM